MKIATWNVNSLKVRLPQVLNWLKVNAIDAIVMQETKLVDELFPVADFNAAGYDVIYCGQKTYNGVALAVRKTSVKSLSNPVYNIPGYPDDQKRFIAADIVFTDDTAVRLCGGYFPNGQEVGCEKFLYKLDWISALTCWLREELDADVSIVLGGDFNIAPTDADLWDPVAWKDQTPASRAERTAWTQLLKTGLVDTWSLGLHAPETYSWWDYRQAGFEKNHGMRIDHILACDSIAQRIIDVSIDAAPRALEKPSDHAPVVITLE